MKKSLRGDATVNREQRITGSEPVEKGVGEGRLMQHGWMLV